MELRKDYILERWILISEGRSKRQTDFKTETKAQQPSCDFCLGNESRTPPEIYRKEESGKWKLRVIPNLYSAVSPKGEPLLQTHNIYYTFAGGYGVHEIIVETPDHNKNFGDIKKEDIKDILKTFSLRINELQKNPVNKYVCLFKNQGEKAGASLRHPHSQIIALGFVPQTIKEKLEAIKKYSSCPYCDIIDREKNSLRRGYENNSFVAFTPYASRFNYEIWILPKNHIRTFNDFNEGMYEDLSDILKKISLKLESMDFAFNIEYSYSPINENLHFHIEIMPRIATWAGFELGFGVNINTVSPETAAKFYRGE